MDTVERVTKVQGSDWIIERHLLGLGVLLLTVSAGYFLSGLSGGRDVRPIAQEARAETAQAESTAATTEPEAEMTLDEHIKEVADRHGVRADLVAAVIEAESEFNPRAVSRRGARGLMQLMPKTAATLGVDDPFDPKANIEAGVKHLRAMMDRFDNNIPLARRIVRRGPT